MNQNFLFKEVAIGIVAVCLCIFAIGLLKNALLVPEKLAYGILFVLFLTGMLIAKGKSIPNLNRQTLIVLILGFLILVLAIAVDHYIVSFFAFTPLVVALAAAPSFLFYLVKFKNMER